MKLTIRFLGLELLLVDLDPASPEPVLGTTPAEQGQVVEPPFGFWGGSGGSTELAYSPYLADRPIDI